jgi:hypothetical protein
MTPLSEVLLPAGEVRGHVEAIHMNTVLLKSLSQLSRTLINEIAGGRCFGANVDFDPVTAHLQVHVHPAQLRWMKVHPGRRTPDARMKSN